MEPGAHHWSVFSQMHLMCDFPYCYPKIHSNIAFPSVQVSSPKIRMHFSPPYLCYMLHPSHPPWLDLPNNIWWSVQVMKFSLCRLLQPLPTSCLLGQNILFSGLFCNILNVYSPLNVRDQVPHLYETAHKRTVVVVFCFCFRQYKSIQF